MFSALKKLVGSDQAAVRDKNIPAGLQSMNQALQRRFAKGVQYNSESQPGPGVCRGQPPGAAPSAARAPAGAVGVVALLPVVSRKPSWQLNLRACRTGGRGRMATF